MNLTILVFFIILTILHIFWALWAETIPSPSRWQLGVYFTPYDLPNKHLKPSSPWGGGSPSLAPGLVVQSLLK